MLDNATGFDWYLDSRRGIYTRNHGAETEMIAIDLETGEERSLFVGPFIEIDVAPDGSAVSFCYGQGHMAMGLAVLQLEPSSDPMGCPARLANHGTWSRPPERGTSTTAAGRRIPSRSSIPGTWTTATSSSSWNDRKTNPAARRSGQALGSFVLPAPQQRMSSP